MSTGRIVATGRVLPIAHEILRPFGSIEVAQQTDERSLTAMMDGTIALIVRGIVPISRGIIEAGRELRVIGRTGVGYENVDVAAATKRGIPVVYAPGAGARPVAEGTLAMLLSLAKRLRPLDQKTRAGEWSARDEILMGDLDGTTLGVVGLGRIGSEVARLAQAFGMRVLGYDPLVNELAAAKMGVALVSLEDLLREADFVSLHAPLNEQSRGLIDATRISTMKRGAVLVNVARGGLLASLDVLQAALESGQLSGVGLDVYPSEPPDVSHPIFQRDDVVCTPHCMGLSRKGSETTFRMVSRGIAAVLSGGTPEHVANPEVLSYTKGSDIAGAKSE